MNNRYSNKTFCIGYWALSSNVKRDLEHYTALLPETFAMLAEKNVVFFYDNDVILEEVMKIAVEYGVNLHADRIALEDLPGRSSAMQVLHATELYGEEHYNPPAIHRKEKALEHYWRDYKKCGQDTYLNMLSIWLSKVPLVSMIAEKNPFESRYFAWADASISRFNGKRDYYRIDKVIDCNDRISFYRGKLVKNGKKLALNASYMSGSKRAWRKLEILFREQSALVENEIYPNDEETVLDHCHTADPALFRMINPKRHIIIVRTLTKLGLGAYRWGCY